MNILNFITESSFSKDKAGRDIFHPLGVLTRGIILDSQQRKNEIKAFLVKTYIVLFALLIVLIIFRYKMSLLILIPCFLLWFGFQLDKLTKGLPKADGDEGYNKRVKALAEKSGLPILIFGNLVGLTVIVACLYVVIFNIRNLGHDWKIWFLICLFGISGVCWVQMLYFAIKK